MNSSIENISIAGCTSAALVQYKAGNSVLVIAGYTIDSVREVRNIVSQYLAGKRVERTSCIEYSAGEIQIAVDTFELWNVAR